MYFFGILVNTCLLLLPLAVTIGTLIGLDAHRRALDEEPLFAKGSYLKRAYADQNDSSPARLYAATHYNFATGDPIRKATIQDSV